MFDLRFDGAAARLTLSRPEARNAIPLGGWDDLAAVLGEVGTSGARVLIVTGEGAFCAGADIGDFGRFREDGEAAAEFRLAMRRALDRLRDLPLPTIALVEGACYGAGVALAIACDIRLGGRDSSFAITPAKFGISYPQEDVHRLVTLVGPGRRLGCCSAPARSTGPRPSGSASSNCIADRISPLLPTNGPKRWPPMTVSPSAS